MKKLIIFLFTFITGLHNKPQGCGAPVASAAGPFSTKKNIAVRMSSSARAVKFTKSQKAHLHSVCAKNCKHFCGGFSVGETIKSFIRAVNFTERFRTFVHIYVNFRKTILKHYFPCIGFNI
jgi:hypothetical protein